MKKIIVILFFIISLPIYADHYLVIELNNLKKHRYSLEDKPIIRFNNDKLVIKTNKIEFDYPIQNIIKYYFYEKKETYIEEVKYDINNIHFTYTNPNFILIEGVTGNENIQIYEINGRICQVDVSKNENSIKIELEKLPFGLYIINIDNKHSIKIIKK